MSHALPRPAAGQFEPSATYCYPPLKFLNGRYFPLDTIYTTRGDGAPLGDLVEHMMDNPDVNFVVERAVVVQTVDRSRVVFDDEYITNDQKVGTAHKRVRRILANRAALSERIIIGEQWDSPLGVTAPVTAIILPTPCFVDYSLAVQRSGLSETILGGQILRDVRRSIDDSQ